MFNRSEIFSRAWALFRGSDELSFAESLRRSWAVAKAAPVNAARIEAAKAAAGVTEDVKTWSDWRKAGYEVVHGSKCLFGVDLIWASKGPDRVYKARFFGASQVAPVAA